MDKEAVVVLAHKLYKVFLFFAASGIVLFVRLARPFLLIRFGRLNSIRIGHFASNTEIYLCERDAGIGNSGSYDIFYCAEAISNFQLKKMWQRILRISPFSNLMLSVDRINRCFTGFNRYIVPLEENRDLHSFYKDTGAHLFFTDEEEYQGQTAMRELGLLQRTPFICFHARDSAYLDSVRKGYDWSYHSYRNSDVQNYIPAAEELARRGNFVIRMGAIAEKPLVSSNPKIIDYAVKHRTDFLDIYLSAKCRFFIGSGSGIDEMPKIFRRPVIYINFIPIDCVEVLNSVRLFIPKKLWLKKERRFLTFRQILDSGIGKFFHSQEYEEAGIDIIDNTADEIKDLAVEMDERLKGVWQENNEGEELQRRFWSLFKPGRLRVEISSRIGAEFLRQNRQLLN